MIEFYNLDDVSPQYRNTEEKHYLVKLKDGYYKALYNKKEDKFVLGISAVISENPRLYNDIGDVINASSTKFYEPNDNAYCVVYFKNFKWLVAQYSRIDNCYYLNNPKTKIINKIYMFSEIE